MLATFLVVGNIPFALEKVIKECDVKPLFYTYEQCSLEIFFLQKPDIVLFYNDSSFELVLQLAQEFKVADSGVTTIVIDSAFDTEHFSQSTDVDIDKYLFLPLESNRLEKVLQRILQKVTVNLSLREYRNFLRKHISVIENSSIVVRVDTHGRIIYANKEFYKKYAYLPREIIGHSFLRLLSLYDARRIRVKVAKNIDNVPIRLSLLSKAKKKFLYLDVTIMTLSNLDGKIIEHIALGHDLSGIAEANDANMRAIFDSEHAMVAVLGKNDIPVLYNKRFLDFFSLPDTSPFPLLMLEEYSAFDRKYDKKIKDLGALKRKLKASPSRSYVLALKSQRGDVHYFAVSLNQMTHTFIHKERLSVLSFIDITELEALKTEQVEAIKLASIGKLAAGVTHEINTPLTYIKGNLELMGYSLCPICAENTEIVEYRHEIYGGLERIISIVDSMSEIASPHEGKKEEANLYTTLIYACRMVYSRAKHIAPLYINGTLFTLTLPRNNEHFMATIYKNKMEQVWLIILNNALDELAQCEGEFEERYVKITIDSNNCDIIVTFEDNAGGIAEELLSSIFDLFVSSKPHSGMGIGLNVAKSIIDDMGGTISATNTDKGAKFTIKLKGC